MSKEMKNSPPSTDAEHMGEVVEDREHDAVFGEITEEGPNFRNVGWAGTAGLMMKTQIGLGVLSFPSVFDTLGMITGVILMCTIAGITTWSNYIVGVFKLNHRQVYGVDDVGQLLFGRIGKEILAVAFMGLYVLTTASAMLSLSICLNALSDHGTCTAVFVAVAFVAVFCLCSIRTLGRITWLAIVGVVSIITAVFIVTIAVGIQDRPPNAPLDAEWKSDYELFKTPTFLEAISAVSTLIFAYAGTGAFFPIVSEMRDPHHYTRALTLCQSVITIVYLVVGIVVYYYCGSYVASPALGSAGVTIKKVAYGIALPGLLVSGVLLAHVSSKYVFVRMLRGTTHLTSNSFTHWATWLGCTFGVCITAYIFASAIPVFNGLVSLAGALFGTLLSFQPMGCMWLYDNWSRGKEAPTLRWRLTVGWCIFVIVSGTFLMVAGTYGSIAGIIDSYKANGGKLPRAERNAYWEPLKSGVEAFLFNHSNVGNEPFAKCRLKIFTELQPTELVPEVSLPRNFTLRPGESKTVSIIFKNPDTLGWNASALPVYGGNIIVSGSNGDRLAVPITGLGADLKRELDTISEPGFPHANNGVDNAPWSSPSAVFGFNLSLSAQDYPKNNNKLIWGSREIRWDIYDTGWKERRWKYPPVVGVDGYVGSATSWTLADIADFDPSWGNPDETFSFPVYNQFRTTLRRETAYYWFGKLANGTDIADGRYAVRFAVLKPLGRPEAADAWQVLKTPEIEIRRQT